MNKVILMGRLTRDPEVRYSQGESATAIARYTLAVDRRFNRNNDENSADFIGCVAFGRSAEFAERYLRKGTKVVVTGRIQTGSYTNKDGVKVYTTDVVVEDQEFAESKNAASISSASCTRPAPRSCSSSRTRRWRCRSPTAPTSLRPARSPSPAPAKSFWKATPSKKPIWAVDFQSIQTDSTQFPLRTVCFLQYPISIAFLGIYVIIRKNHNLHPNTKRKGWFFMKMKRVWRVHAS